MIAILAGFFAGIVSGMGIGGGMLLIPALVFFLFMPQKAAQAINLWYFLPTAVVALIIHTKNKKVEYKKSLWIIASGIPASLLGAYMATGINSALLGKLFGIFLGIFGLKEVYDGFTNKE